MSELPSLCHAGGRVKAHLFYTFLAIFAVTAVITLLGITGTISIRDQYLAPLFGAFLIELTGAVIALYRRADFFSLPGESHGDDARPPPSPYDGPVAKGSDDYPAAPSSPAQATVGQEQEAPRSSDHGSSLDLEEYLRELKRLEGRFFEVNRLKTESNGRPAWFRGKVFNVRASKLGPSITLDSQSNKWMSVTVYAKEEHLTAAFALQPGDLVEAHGRLDTSILSLDDADFKRI